ncbi:hypothetical protein BV25DRAFT_1817745 [Artomyces pyxidatus]|uniref:Uncharacterized protein n=1 Tax=Artomyces pyxidatus TaxID=48021 RepID=A0ACB8TK78_9AGAM|nr:hypothetical protein BV25DRAFT_1817745 [Artomyces pyxidatus]
MDSTPTSPSEYAPPPPAYQVSQDEFDQKISDAVRQSSATRPPAFDADGWPIYNEAAFEDVAASYRQSSQSQGQSSEGVRRGTRMDRRRDITDVKPRLQPQRPSERRRRNANVQPTPAIELPPELLEDEERGSTPPPPFTMIGPDLNGPPFEEVVRLSYHPPDSRAASPLSSPQRAPPRELPHFASRPLSSNSQHSSAPSVSPLSNRPVANRLSSPMTSHVDFDPSVAYAKTTTYYPDAQRSQLEPFGANAFYNTAVASQLTSALPTSQRHDYRDMSSQSLYHHRATPSLSMAVSPVRRSDEQHYPLFAAQPSAPNFPQPHHAIHSPPSPSFPTARPTGPRWSVGETQSVRAVYQGRR